MFEKAFFDVLVPQKNIPQEIQANQIPYVTKASTMRIYMHLIIK